MTMFTTLFREKQLKDLKALSRQTDHSVAEIIRQAVDIVMANPSLLTKKK